MDFYLPKIALEHIQGQLKDSQDIGSKSIKKLMKKFVHGRFTLFWGCWSQQWKYFYDLTSSLVAAIKNLMK